MDVDPSHLFAAFSWTKNHNRSSSCQQWAAGLGNNYRTCCRTQPIRLAHAFRQKIFGWSFQQAACQSVGILPNRWFVCIDFAQQRCVDLQPCQRRMTGTGPPNSMSEKPRPPPIGCWRDAALTHQMEWIMVPLWDICNSSGSSCHGDGNLWTHEGHEGSWTLTQRWNWSPEPFWYRATALTTEPFSRGAFLQSQVYEFPRDMTWWSETQELREFQAHTFLWTSACSHIGKWDICESSLQDFKV